LGRQFLEPLAGTLFFSGAQSAFQKIRAHFGDAALRHLEKLAANPSGGTPAAPFSFQCLRPWSLVD
jgi:hypothetical protein